MGSNIGPETGDADPRMKVCREIGIADPIKAHEIIVEGVKKGARWLLQRKLNALRLTQLGYTMEGMRKLGCDDAMLEQLGYRMPRAAKPHAAKSRPAEERAPAEPDEPVEENVSQTIRRLIHGGARVNELKAAGYIVDQVKRVGFSASEMTRLGYDLAELISVSSLMELKRADFGARDLRRFFSGEELRRGGFGADEMRLAGYTVRDLLQFGYPENQVRVAGFSNAELVREGLSRTTRI
jgi:hypothetical protein